MSVFFTMRIPKHFQPIRWSSTQWNSTRQAGDGDFSVPDPFSEKAPSASFSDPGESSKVWRLGWGRKKRATNPSPPPGDTRAGLGGGQRSSPGRGSRRLPRPAARPRLRSGLRGGRRVAGGGQWARCISAGRSPRRWRCL